MGTATVALYDIWLDFRDRCLTSKPFHDFMLKLPFSRPLVRKRQNELFDIVSGFVYSQILFTCVELNIFSFPKLRKPGATLDELASYTGLGLDEVKRLAKGAASLRLLEERRGRFRLGDLGAALSINEGALAMIRHHHAFYKDLVDPLDLLRSGKRDTHLSNYWDYARNPGSQSTPQEAIEPYSQLMSASQQMVSEEILASFDLSAHRHLMDVGGGQGTFLSNVAKKYPVLELTLFDLPQTISLTEEKLKERNEDQRIKLCGGSFFADELPHGSDIISLIRILHDHDDEPALQILRAVYQALEPGGALLICEPMSTGGSAHRISDAYFNFYLYAMGSGRPRSPDELTEMLKIAGFHSVSRVSTRSPFITSILLAQK